MRNLVLVNHLSLLHLLYCHDLTSLSVPAHSNLTKGSSSDDLEGLEISNSNFSPPTKILLSITFHLRESKQLGLLVLDFLFDQILLSRRQVHLVHLLQQLVPSYTAIMIKRLPSFFSFSSFLSLAYFRSM